jgi:hypothetical protein
VSGGHFLARGRFHLLAVVLWTEANPEMAQRLLRSRIIEIWMTFVKSYAMLIEKGGNFYEEISELSV